MTLFIDIKGLEQVMHEVRKRINADKIAPYAKDGAELAREWVYDEIDRPKTGRKWAGLPNRSSAPGDTPAHQFGDLRRGLQVRKRTSVKGGTYAFRSTAAHAHDLEYGHFKAAPRPYMRRSVDANYKAILDAMTGEFV